MLTDSFITLTLCVLAVQGQVKNIVLTNDDGWAVAQIRAQNDALKAAGFNVSVQDSLLLIAVQADAYCCLLGRSVSSDSKQVRDGLKQCHTGPSDTILRVQHLSYRISCGGI